MRSTLVLSIAALLAAAWPASPAAAQKQGAAVKPVSAQARSLYERSRASVAQIRVLLGASDSQAAAGTGFVAGSGLILTNYHVVSDKALEPDVYRLEFVLPDGRRGPLRIIAVDVLHDLAVVAGDVPGARPFAFRDAPLQKGDKGFSFGYPLAQGLSVVEGTYNGRSEENYYETIHFTGAINPGMSGGPVVDQAGRVFGVNVATNLRGQLVSFLVPAKFAKPLLARAEAGRGRDTDFRPEVGGQLRTHAQGVMAALLKGPLPVQKVGELEMPTKLGDPLQCRAGTERETDRPYTVDSYYCYTVSYLYVDSRLYTGGLWFRHAVLRAKDLGALGFAYVLEKRFGPNAYESFDRRDYTRWSCSDEIVALQGSRAKAAICVRRYKRFEGLYDLVLSVVTLGDSALALHSELHLTGVPFTPALEFSKRYIEAIRWSR
jgi:serine protease Do